MAAIVPGADTADTEIVLKTIAPRAPLHLVARPRLGSAEAGFRDRQIVLLQAPAGYGKTSLLAQWRREHLARGGAVAWLRADERDEAGRFLLGLVHAVKSGCARPAFGRLLLDGAVASAGELDGATAWLAEVAQLSLDILLIVDEVERLPAAGAEVLTYLLHNAPQNLRFTIAGRRGLEASVPDLLTYGRGVLIGPELLRFRLDETIALVGARFGSRIGPDVCARLFEATDGWPLGLQLSLAAMTHATDPRQAAEALASGPASLRDHLVGALLAKLSPEDDSFLTRISVVDTLHPDLCHALTGDAHAREQLARLVRETPVFITAEDSKWCRLHALVRDALRTRLASLPDPVQADLHGRATAWLAGQGMLEEAARHAHAAGQHQIAYELAERSLHDAVQQGHLGAVLDWLELIPDAELEKRPRLRLAAAWALALGQRHEEAGRQVKRILDGPDADDTELRYECAMILSAATYFADDPDRFLELYEPWATATPSGTSWLAQIHANRLAARALLLGELAQVRRWQQLVPRAEVGKGLGYLVRWGDHLVGLSYVAEGQLRLAEEVLLPALASAEADLGRRHPLACMFAATCAAIAYEDDRIDEAAALLANRLDMLERSAIPETLSVAYCTAARIAAHQGIEHRALDLLESMYAMGVTRRLPRLCIASLTEQVRMHAGRYRVQTCEALVRRIDEIVAQEAAHHGPLWVRSVTLLQSLSHAGAAIAARHWPQALDALASAGEIAESMKMGRYRIEIMALRAFVLDQSGGEGRPLLLEAMNLAQTFNLTRMLADAHPALAEWARQVSQQEGQTAPGLPAMAARRIVRADARGASTGLRALPSIVLTPKEREILELLARNLSNKEIAVATTVGEGTVKWHLKNLFGKLDASSRKHAVRRALALGLLEGTQ